MIEAELNSYEFAYDIHSLIKAFYPAEEVTVFEEEKAPGREDSRKACPEGDGSGREDPIRVRIDFGPEQVSCRITDASGSVLAEDGRSAPPVTDRKGRRNALKTLLYRLLSQVKGSGLPWGDLTGIRPTKIPMDLLNEGCVSSGIPERMQRDYFVSPAKADLALRIAEREKRILDSIPWRQGYSLYIGIPFCPSICLYCSFSSSPLHLWKDRVDEYLDALEKEMRACADLFSPLELQSIYIGGGTPTTLESGQMDRLLSLVEECFDLSRVRELSVEAGRPDTITRDRLEVLRSHKVDRISINPQSMNQETLDRIGRMHTTDGVREAYELARSMGFDNINMDTIVGLPGEGEAQVRHTMETLAAMRPENITVHSLAVKRGSRLQRMLEEYREESFRNDNGIMEMTERICADIDLYPYYLYRQKNMAGNLENVGYAAEGREGLYNILIMEEVQSILALGAGASTKIVLPGGRIERIENVKDIASYMGRIDDMIQRKQAVRRMLAGETVNRA